MNRFSVFVLSALIPLAAGAVQVPRPIASDRSDFTTRSLKDNCFSMQGPFDLPCNPAFLPIDPKTRFEAHFFLRNNVDYLQDALEVFNNQADTETVRGLFSQTRDARFEADLEALYRSKSWAISVSPSRLSYYTLVRNRVLPYASVYAAQDHVLRGQYAYQFSDSISFGVQVVGRARRFVLSDLFATEAVAEGGAERLFRIRDQQALFVEPGVVWADETYAWRPQASLMVTRTGWLSEKIDELPVDPEAELGGSVRPFENIEELELGAHVSFNSFGSRAGDHIRLASQYGFYEYHHVIGSLTQNELALGYAFTWNWLQLGGIWESQQVENLIDEKETVQTWSFQVGGFF